MHELLHTFGFLSFVDSAGNNTSTNWMNFDKFVVTSDGTAAPIDHTTYSWISTYNTNLTGDRRPVLRRPNAEAAYGGQPVPLYTPTHGSPAVRCRFGRFDVHRRRRAADECRDRHRPGYQNPQPIEVGILKDLGYSVADPPQTLAIFVIGFAFIRRRKRSAEYCAR